jgi:hypothetical protein
MNGPSNLDRRLRFEKSHPEVVIITPLKSRTAQWEARWDTGGQRYTITTADVTELMDRLSAAFSDEQT